MIPDEEKIEPAHAEQEKKEKLGKLFDHIGKFKPIYTPKRHTVQTYRHQQRAAKNRKKRR